MPNYHVEFTPANSLTITETGNYEIMYFAAIDPTSTADITISVRRNNNNLLAATVTRRLTGNEQSVFSGSVIVPLAANDVIDLAATAAASETINLRGGTNATLSVKKLD